MSDAAVDVAGEAVDVGRVAAIYRYPVRSMRGESLDEVEISKLGLVGDRAYSVFDPTDNAMASASTGAQNWKGLLQWQVAFAFDPQLDADPPPIRLTSSEGEVLRSESEGFEQALTGALGRPARIWAGDTRGALSCSALERRAIQRGQETGTLEMPSVPYPSAPVHVLTTASLGAARAEYPGGRFEAERFRPNIVVETPSGLEGFVEKSWLQRRLAIGESAAAGGLGAELSVFDETERCVLTTHAQFDLPKDLRILRTLTVHNRTQMGIYASVPQRGRIRVGDPVSLRARAVASNT